MRFMARRTTGFRLTAVACGLAVAAGALVSASGVLADAASPGPQAVRAQLAYRCGFAAGPRPVGVTVAASFPSAAAAGQPIKVSGLRASAALPPSVAAGLRRQGATVTGRDVLSIAETANAKPAIALWPGRTRKPVPIPADGRLRLTFSGPVPPVTATAPGTVTFTAAQLNVALTVHTAKGLTSTAAITPVACTLTSAKRAKLASVQVTAAAGSPSPSPSAAGRHGTGPATRTGSGIPPDCVKHIVHGGTTSPTLGCAYLIGYADVHKLNEAALVGPAPSGNPPAALLNADTYATDVGCVPPEPTTAACIKHGGSIHVYICTGADLNYQNQLQFPPARATFLNFGFVPVTAIMQLSQTSWPSNHPPTENPKCYKGIIKNKPVKLKSPIITVFSDANNTLPSQPVVSTGTTYLTIHVSQVTVNGVPLPVGPDCGVDQRMKAVLVGRGTNVPYSGYTLDLGGPLTGSVTIKQFSHCGVGENLNPLLDAGISGPNNFQLITQGTLCTPQQTGKPGCPPTVPKPVRHLKS